ncbi:MAG: phosphoribosyl-ATP diphosphatase [Anaerolineae bacterium]|nr:phosphoribosyl-ATP diphosphatase [Anaerolineae bacterium]
MLTKLEAIIQDRRDNPRPGSYTNSLFTDGPNRMAQKVGEEAVEVVVAALGQPRDLQIAELADLFYHTLVLMNHLNITLDDVYQELERRHAK